MPDLATSTPDRALIARRNGARSRGPVTPAGKARSARNATRHGLCARTLVLEDGADALALAELRAALLARWQPMDAAEAHLVEELVFAAWREVRLRAVEDAVLVQAASGAPPAPGLPSLATLLRYRARIERDAQAATERLLALRRGRRELAEPAQLRWLAGRIEQARAILAGEPPEAAADDEKCTNELKSGTNEPEGAPSPPPPAGPQPARDPQRGMDEPRHGLPPLAVLRAEVAREDDAGAQEPPEPSPAARLPAAA